MAYLDIIFHNIQSKNHIYTGGPAAYTRAPNVCDRPILARLGYGAAPASAGWGSNVAGAADFSGVFFCESPEYAQYAGGWAVPPLPLGGAAAVYGLTPVTPPNHCAFLDRPAPVLPIALPPPPPPPPPAPGNWFGGVGGIHVIGTGSVMPPPPQVLPPVAPPGSHRYGIYFQAGWNYHGGLVPVTGLFVHTMHGAVVPGGHPPGRVEADMGTQIAALCRLFPDAIVFGDLNLDMVSQWKRTSLSEAVGGTHRLLFLRQNGGLPYITHPAPPRRGTAIDYALVPDAHTQDVEIWGVREPGAAATLWRNGSDHSVMRLRIRVTEADVVMGEV